MSTDNLYKYKTGEVYAAEKIPQPIPGTGIVNIIAPDGATPIAFTSITLYDDAVGTTELVLDTDYTIQENDTYYSGKEGVQVYRSVQIINAAYQSSAFYVDADVLLGYVNRETFLDGDNTYTGDNTFNGDNTHSGANTFTGATPQVASAWVNFNGTGTVAIRDDYNVSSITDNGTGDYTVNIDVDLANANYSICGTIVGYADGNTTRAIVVKGSDAGGASAKSASAVTIQTGATGAATLIDTAEINIQIFGGV